MRLINGIYMEKMCVYETICDSLFFLVSILAQFLHIKLFVHKFSLLMARVIYFVSKIYG